MEKDFIPQFEVPPQQPDNQGFLSTLFGQGSDFQGMIEETEELTKKEEAKVALFEKGLAQNLRPDDSIDQAMEKVVKTALAAEFGPSLVKAKGAGGMVETIVRGIMGDPVLRKQALLIMDRYTQGAPKKTVQPGSKKKQ